MSLPLPLLPPQPYYPGSWVLYGEDPWKVVHCLESGRIRIGRVGQISLEVEAKHLRPLKTARLHLDRLKLLLEYPEDKQCVALERHRVIQEALDRGWSQGNLLIAAKKLGVSNQTITRWTDWFIVSGNRVEVFVPGVFRYGVAHHKFLNPVEKIIKEGITTIWLDETKPPLSALMSWIETTCEAQGFDAPSRSSIKHRLSKISRGETTLQREGLKAARDEHSLLPGRAPTGRRPLGKIEIDHTITNIFVRLPSGKTVRLWITIAVDLYTRMVVGFYLSLDRPSRVAVGLCLYRVMTSRVEWLRLHGIVASWPCIGVPEVVSSDSGKDLTSDDFHRWALQFGFKIQKRKRRRPEGGGHIENIMGKAAMAMDIFPGKTFRSVVEKGAYNAQANAVMTIDEVEKAFLHFFIEIYHESPHRGLRGRAPIGVWEEWEKENSGKALRQQEPQQAGNDLLMTLLPSFEATIQQNGVARKKVVYFDYALKEYAGEKNPDSENGKWRFHFHPRYSKYIHWKFPRTGRWMGIAARDLSMPNLSEEERVDLETVDANRAKATIRWNRIYKGRQAIYQLLQKVRARLKGDLANAKRRKGKIAPRQTSEAMAKDSEVLDLASNKALLNPLTPDPRSQPEEFVGERIIPIFEVGSL